MSLSTDRSIDRTPFVTGLLFTALAAGAVAVQSEGIGDYLRDAHAGWSESEISESQSWIITYLFAVLLAGAGMWLLTWRGATHHRRWTLPVAIVTFVLGSAIQIYNLTQPHPMVITLTGLLPSIAGLWTVISLWRARDSAV